MPKIDDLLKEVKKEAEVTSNLKSSLNEFAEKLAKELKDNNEEFLATYVEGTKRLINKEEVDYSGEFKTLEMTTKEKLDTIEGSLTDVERAIKGIRPTDVSPLLLETRTSKNQLKKILDKIDKFNIDWPTKASEALPVRLSDGENFYRAIEEIASFPTKFGGGGGEFAYMDSQGSRGYGLIDSNRHVQVDLIPSEFELNGNTAHTKKYYTASAPTDGIVWSPAAGKRWYITDLIVNVDTDSVVTFEDDKVAGDSVVMKFDLAANSGVSHSFNTPLYSGEDAADLIVTATAGNVYVTATGYEI